MGDFYETFDEDARVVSRELEIALTAREMGKGTRVPLAGIPYHALESYLARLIKKGYRVAICEQTSDPATSRGLVDREVVRVVTPGTIVEESILDRNVNNYLAAVALEGEEAGLAYVDITTSEFAATQLGLDALAVELGRLTPAELIAPEGQGSPYPNFSPEGEGAGGSDGAHSSPVLRGERLPAVTHVDPALFHLEWATEGLLRHFGAVSLEPFGCERLPLATRAAGAIVEYLGKNQKTALGQIGALHTYSTGAHMALDPQTKRNLELFEGGRWGDAKASLISTLDRTKTAMGGRLMRRWLGQPLLDLDALERRLDAVEWHHRSALRRGRITSLLESVSDLERLINRVRAGAATPRDLSALAMSLRAAPQIRAALEEDDDVERVAWLAGRIHDNEEVVRLISTAIVDDPPVNVADGGVIKDGFSPDLDSLRSSSGEARSYIASLESKERKRTGIRSLKVGYNRVFGYYIEVSRSNVELVPDDYIRRQTLVGGERYITPEMKEYEAQVLSADERIFDLEASLFRQVSRQIGEAVGPIMETAAAVARTDVLASLAEVAARQGYVRPKLDDGPAITIKQGRHPVVEQTLPAGSFVPNDTALSSQDEQLIVLTGPNMAGKSTYLRQVAVITLMAQVGSFVPAEEAAIGLADRIFTRVGLQDDLSAGQSTFMVEMVETAAILNHATRRSLVVLDEIGRGTSTYDGLAIARAVAEYIHNHPRLGCKTLFATHYHELTALADVLPRAKNYNVAVSEDQGRVIFMRRIVPGGADRSYGVHVARLAGLPGGVVNRAWEALRDLEGGGASTGPADGRRAGPSGPAVQQLSFLDATPAAIESLLELDVASMTPIEAITKLFELQELARNADQAPTKPVGIA